MIARALFFTGLVSLCVSFLAMILVSRPWTADMSGPEWLAGSWFWGSVCATAFAAVWWIWA